MSSDLSPLAQLTYGLRPQPRAQLGEAGELKWLPMSALFIDPKYQRAILDSGKANIRRMIEQFAWSQFGTLVVSKRGGGRYAIIDGQHRATAAMLHGGIKELPCLILTLDAPEEARAFFAINSNVTRIHSLQTFRAKVAAGDVDAVELTQLCARAGVKIVGYPKQYLDGGETMALGSIRQAIKRFDERTLTTALKLLRAAEPASGLGASAILGASSALHKNPDWRTKAAELGQQLATRGGIAKLQERAGKRKASYGGTEWSNFEVVLVDTINMAERSGGNLALMTRGR